MAAKPKLSFITVPSDQEARKLAKPPLSCEWPPSQVASLLDTYSRKLLNGNGCLRNKDWEDVVNDVNGCGESLNSEKTVKQCRDKVDSLKRRYKIEKRKACNGSSVAWPFFSKMDDLMAISIKQDRVHDQINAQFLRRPSLHLGYRNDEAGRLEDNFEHSDSEEDGTWKNKDEILEDSICYLANGMQRHSGMLDGQVLFEDGHKHTSRFKRPLGDESADYSSEHAMWASGSESSHDKKYKCMGHDGAGHASTRFTEIFAHIEAAKTEILTKIKLEMADLQKRRTKKTASKQKF